MKTLSAKPTKKVGPGDPRHGRVGRSSPATDNIRQVDLNKLGGTRLNNKTPGVGIAPAPSGAVTTGTRGSFQV